VIEMDKNHQSKFFHGTSGTLLPKVWDVTKETNTKLGQEDSLGLGMRLTWKKT
jgi:hypothetical protein